MAAPRTDEHVGNTGESTERGRDPEQLSGQAERTPRGRHRPHRPNGQRRPRSSLLRLGNHEHEILAAAAERSGLTLAGYCAAASLAAAQGSAVPAPPVREAMLELVAARSAVARVGANVNQIAKASNAGAAPAWPQLEGYLRVLQATAQRLETASQQLLARLR